jgi:hypothetical protein
MTKTLEILPFLLPRVESLVLKLPVLCSSPSPPGHYFLCSNYAPLPFCSYHLLSMCYLHILADASSSIGLPPAGARDNGEKRLLHILLAILHLSFPTCQMDLITLLVLLT